MLPNREMVWSPCDLKENYFDRFLMLILVHSVHCPYCTTAAGQYNAVETRKALQRKTFIGEIKSFQREQKSVEPEVESLDIKRKTQSTRRKQQIALTGL